MSRFSDQPSTVEAAAFALFWQDKPGWTSSAFDEEDWQAVWRTVDEVTKEQYREQAQQAMREFEDNNK